MFRKPLSRVQKIPNAVLPPKRLIGTLNGGVDMNKIFTFDDPVPVSRTKNKKMQSVIKEIKKYSA